jgi:nucleoside-diphosphate-sugar epimerase
MILLTGASGFIGKHLLAALIRDYGSNNVLALTSKPIEECPYLLHNDYNFSDELFAENNYADAIDTIIHAGAFIPKSSVQANDWKLCNQNIFTTQRLLSAKLPQLKRVLYLSSSDIYGKSALISEDSLVDPISLYGQSKLYSEKMIGAWAEREGKICQVLRVGHVYGPGEEAYQKIIPVTIKKIIAGSHVEIWGNGNELRSFIYIDDVVKAILASLSLKENPGVINLVSSQQISIGDLVEKLISISERSVKIERISARSDTRDMIFNNSKMLKYLLKSETPFMKGLVNEWAYMSKLSI